MRSSPVIASRRWRSCASQRRASGVPVAATASAGAVPNARSATDGGAPARSTARRAAAASSVRRQADVSPSVGHVARDGRQHGERGVAGVAERVERPLHRRAIDVQPRRQPELHGALQRRDGVGLGERQAQLVADARPRHGGERARGDRLAGQLARCAARPRSPAGRGSARGATGASGRRRTTRRAARAAAPPAGRPARPAPRAAARPPGPARSRSP